MPHPVEGGLFALHIRSIDHGWGFHTFPYRVHNLNMRELVVLELRFDPTEANT